MGVLSLSTSNRRVFVAPLVGVELQGRGSLGGGGFALGLQNTLSCSPQAVRGTHPLPVLQSLFHQGQGLGVGSALVKKGAVELAPLPSPGFYSWLLVVMKASGSWRPVSDLSLLNLKVLKTSFKMQTLQSVLSVQRGDRMVSLDLKDAYLQVPVHPDSRKYLRFVAFGQVYQFKALCFGLSTAPQVFTRVMTPVSTFIIPVSASVATWTIG